jgi:hypothetical protein
MTTIYRATNAGSDDWYFATREEAADANVALRDACGSSDPEDEQTDYDGHESARGCNVIEGTPECDTRIMREGPPENLPCYTCVHDGNYRAKKGWYPCLYCSHLPLQPTPPRSGDYYQRMPNVKAEGL